MSTIPYPLPASQNREFINAIQDGISMLQSHYAEEKGAIDFLFKTTPNFWRNIAKPEQLRNDEIRDGLVVIEKIIEISAGMTDLQSVYIVFQQLRERMRKRIYQIKSFLSFSTFLFLLFLLSLLFFFAICVIL